MDVRNVGWRPRRAFSVLLVISAGVALASCGASVPAPAGPSNGPNVPSAECVSVLDAANAVSKALTGQRVQSGCFSPDGLVAIGGQKVTPGSVKAVQIHAVGESAAVYRMDLVLATNSVERKSSWMIAPDNTSDAPVAAWKVSSWGN